MKNPIRRGLSFIGAGVGFIIIEEVFGFLKPLLINSVTKLWAVQPLMILEIIALGVMGAGAIMILNERYGWFKNENSEESDKPSYITHLATLSTSISSKIKNNEALSAYDAIKQLEDLPRTMVIQHMFTYEKKIQREVKLYSWYRMARTFDNNLNSTQIHFFNKFSKMINEIKSLGFDNPPSESWIQVTDLMSAFGIRQNGILSMVRDNLRTVDILDGYQSRNDITIDFDSGKQEYTIEVPNNPFAGSKSEEKAKLLLDTIKKHMKGLSDSYDEIKRNKSSSYIGIYDFNEFFNNLALSPDEHGYTNFGACHRCSIHFPKYEKKEYDKLIKRAKNKDEFTWDDKSWI